jgi:hypothetical protein
MGPPVAPATKKGMQPKQQEGEESENGLREGGHLRTTLRHVEGPECLHCHLSNTSACRPPLNVSVGQQGSLGCTAVWARDAGHARVAYIPRPTGMDPPLHTVRAMDDDEARGVESLSDGELAVLVRFVRVLVDHDESVLHESGAYDDGSGHYSATYIPVLKGRLRRTASPRREPDGHSNQDRHREDRQPHVESVVGGARTWVAWTRRAVRDAWDHRDRDHDSNDKGGCDQRPSETAHVTTLGPRMGA